MNKPARGAEFLPKTFGSHVELILYTRIEVVQVFRTPGKFADTLSGDRLEISAFSLQATRLERDSDRGLASRRDHFERRDLYRRKSVLRQVSRL